MRARITSTLLAAIFIVTGTASAQEFTVPIINEILYDGVGGDAGMFTEIGAPPGMTMELQSLKYKGGCTMNLDLTMVVSQAEMDIEVAMKCTIRANTEEMPMSMKMDMNVKVEPKAVTEVEKDE